VKCNPHAEPKLDESGRCICAAPYTGDQCDRCDTGFKPSDVKETEIREDSKHHVECVVDFQHASSAVCNSHGRPKSGRFTKIEEITCDCEAGFGGKYCDFCKDNTQAYPACSEKISASIYD